MSAIGEILNAALHAILNLFNDTPSHVTVEIPEDVPQPGITGRGECLYRLDSCCDHLIWVLRSFRIRERRFRRKPRKRPVVLGQGACWFPLRSRPRAVPQGHRGRRSAEGRERDQQASRQAAPPGRRRGSPRLCIFVGRAFTETSGVGVWRRSTPEQVG